MSGTDGRHAGEPYRPSRGPPPEEQKALPWTVSGRPFLRNAAPRLRPSDPDLKGGSGEGVAHPPPQEVGKWARGNQRRLARRVRYGNRNPARSTVFARLRDRRSRSPRERGGRCLGCVSRGVGLPGREYLEKLPDQSPRRPRRRRCSLASEGHSLIGRHRFCIGHGLVARESLCILLCITRLSFLAIPFFNYVYFSTFSLGGYGVPRFGKREFNNAKGLKPILRRNSGAYRELHGAEVRVDCDMYSYGRISSINSQPKLNSSSFLIYN